MDSNEYILSSSSRSLMILHLDFLQIKLNLFLLDLDPLIFSSLCNFCNCFQVDLTYNKGIANKGSGMHTESGCHQHVFVILQETLFTLSEIIYAIKTVIQPSIPFASVGKKGTLALLLQDCVLSESYGAGLCLGTDTPDSTTVLVAAASLKSLHCIYCH